MSDKKEFKGKSVESAIEKGLKKLGCKREDVKVTVLDEGKAGLFGLMGAEPSKVRLEFKSSSSAAADLDWDYALEKTGRFTDLIINAIAENSDCDIKKSENCVSVDIKSDDSSLLIGKQGDTLMAVEYILNLMMKKDPRSRIDVEIDIEGYKKDRLKNFIIEAREAAAEVIKTGKSVELPPMKRSMRKKVHNAVNDIDGVDTESRGRGKARKIVIKKA